MKIDLRCNRCKENKCDKCLNKLESLRTSPMACPCERKHHPKGLKPA